MEVCKSIMCVCLAAVLVSDLIIAAPSLSRDMTSRTQSVHSGLQKAINHNQGAVIKSRTKRSSFRSRTLRRMRRCISAREEGRRLSAYCKKLLRRENHENTLIVIWE